MSEGSENERIATAFNEKGLGGNYFVKCMQDAIRTKNLQEICEKLSGKKEAGRYLQEKPLVIQCNTCGNDFSIKKGVVFVEETINLDTLANIINHLCTCDGIVCDCGTKRPYLEDCKKCKIEWAKSSHHYLDYRKDYPFTKKQREQIKKYNKMLEGLKVTNKPSA